MNYTLIRTSMILLIFGSVASLAYQSIPYILQRYTDMQKKRMNTTAAQLYNMFIFTEKRRLLPLFMLLPLVFGLIGFIFLKNPIGVLLGLSIGFVLPKLLIKQITKKRRIDFSIQLVDGLTMLSSSLRAGMSLNQAFDVIVEEMPPPISDEFALLIRENQMGVSMNNCLSHLKQRMPVEDLDLITIAINIARETGGDLTEVFSQLVFTIREKRKLEGRVRALTAQGKLQGAIMSLLPIAFGTFIYFMSPDTFHIMLEDEMGRLLLIWAAISEVIGIILIMKLSKVEV